eukprot:Phypoly_transcript_03893.p1 GENE.Phypoly_transcript_03893~~Phypoly_transcript_03893.p1  ORF type:complete len:616 (+),score=105.38 Phypoly_transcript_03893:124-1971(+)
MKSYSSCDEPKHPTKKKIEQEPSKSLLTGLRKISPTASAAFLVGVLEAAVGLILLFPFVLGLVYTHYGLITFGAYGILLMIFGLVGAVGVEKGNVFLVQAFFIWKICSVLLVIGIVAGVILMVVFDAMPEISSLWLSILIIVILGVVFIMWSVGGIMWVHPLYYEMHHIPVGGIHEDGDMAILSKEENPISSPQAMQGSEIGRAPTEDPIRMAVRLFNKNPESGIRYLTERSLIDGSFKDVAKFLHTAEDINTSKLGEYLGANKPFNAGVLQAFVDYIDFSKLEFDNALREFLSRFRLPGEAQQIDRIMECFAQRYHANNPGIFHDSDTAYLLAFSLIMLNTDAHNPAIKHKMSKKAFVANNTGIRGKDDIPVSYLEMLYDRIVQNEIKMEADGLFTRAAHKGWLDKRSTTNKWQKRWFVLKNNCLYYFSKPEDDDPRVIIPLEGLLIRKIESQAPSSSTPIHPSCIFEIVDPYARTIKSVKLQSSKGPSEGGHERFVFMAANPEDADEWVNILQNNVLGNPLLSLIKKRKSQVSRKSNAGPGRQSPSFPPPALSPPLASSSSSSHKPAAMLPATIDPSDVDINLSPPPSPTSSSVPASSSSIPLAPISHKPEAS